LSAASFDELHISAMRRGVEVVIKNPQTGERIIEIADSRFQADRRRFAISDARNKGEERERDSSGAG